MNSPNLSSTDGILNFRALSDVTVKESKKNSERNKAIATLNIEGKTFKVKLLVSKDIKDDSNNELKDIINKVIDTYQITANTESFSLSNNQVSHVKKTPNGEKEEKYEIKKDLDPEKVREELEPIAGKHGIKLPETFNKASELDKPIEEVLKKLNNKTSEIKNNAEEGEEKAEEPTNVKSRNFSSDEELRDFLKKLQDLRNAMLFKQIFSMETSKLTF